MSTSDIRLISTASSLHDIGKIAIPDKILNKPGRFTPKEYEIMKTHSEIGAAMLKNLTEYQDEPLLKASYEICRRHHERYDGKGYPDGLKGDEIPKQPVRRWNGSFQETEKKRKGGRFPHGNKEYGTFIT